MWLDVLKAVVIALYIALAFALLIRVMLWLPPRSNWKGPSD